ncbi:hypothetical protein [Helicobacter cetorum]|uniref:Uncharacterized protein n=1 Tax=Helicobacter cetorum (strain ATCC BAA-540 / CCUG 52418 / MIT 99-5656) TaxID=1163745 RepID=I0ES08_HELCM|nr:hypothetical protein [Helicobacter cetorum]AFI05727.1 hypothetical protein HCD_03555 [Helicobacter cetorum MIT 99-5656]
MSYCVKRLQEIEVYKILQERANEPLKNIKELSVFLVSLLTTFIIVIYQACYVVNYMTGKQIWDIWSLSYSHTLDNEYFMFHWFQGGLLFLIFFLAIHYGCGAISLIKNNEIKNNDWLEMVRMLSLLGFPFFILFLLFSLFPSVFILIDSFYENGIFQAFKLLSKENSGVWITIIFALFLLLILVCNIIYLIVRFLKFDNSIEKSMLYSQILDKHFYFALLTWIVFVIVNKDIAYKILSLKFFRFTKVLIVVAGILFLTVLMIISKEILVSISRNIALHKIRKAINGKFLRKKNKIKDLKELIEYEESRIKWLLIICERKRKDDIKKSNEKIKNYIAFKILILLFTPVFYGISFFERIYDRYLKFKRKILIKIYRIFIIKKLRKLLKKHLLNIKKPKIKPLKKDKISEELLNLTLRDYIKILLKVEIWKRLIIPLILLIFSPIYLSFLYNDICGKKDMHACKARLAFGFNKKLADDKQATKIDIKLYVGSAKIYRLQLNQGSCVAYKNEEKKNKINNQPLSESIKFLSEIKNKPIQTLNPTHETISIYTPCKDTDIHNITLWVEYKGRLEKIEHGF